MQRKKQQIRQRIQKNSKVQCSTPKTHYHSVYAGAAASVQVHRKGRESFMTAPNTARETYFLDFTLFSQNYRRPHLTKALRSAIILALSKDSRCALAFK